MQALTLTRFQKRGFDAAVLQDVAKPEPQAQQVRVRMRAAAFNPADLHIISGEMKMMSPVKPPFALGVDGAGVVDAVGTNVRGWAVGDEVFFYTGLVHGGTMAEYAVVDAAWLATQRDGQGELATAASAQTARSQARAWGRFTRNFVVQGTAADFMKMAMLAVDGWLKKSAWPARILLQVHDELVIEVAADGKTQPVPKKPRGQKP